MNKEIKIAGKKIVYHIYGNGKPVMLIHGFGETSDVWKNQINFLKDHFQLIVPDLPGSGQSEMIEDMSMEGMAEVIKLILDSEVNFQLSESFQVSPTGGELEGASPSRGGGALIGHSMGGYIALAFAKKYSHYLTAFGLFHSSAYADNEDKKATRKKGIEFIHEHGAFEFLKTTSLNLFSPHSKQQKPGMVDEFIRSLKNFSASTLVSYYEAMMHRPDSTGLLKSTALPVLFVVGEFDAAVPLQDGLRLSLLPEKSYIHILHQSGHMGMLEEPDKSNHFLNKFLSET